MLQDLKKASSGETLSDDEMGNGSVLSASNSQRKVCKCLLVGSAMSLKLITKDMFSVLSTCR